MKNDYEIRGDVTAIFLRRKDGTVLETLISTPDLEKVNQFPHTWVVMFSKYTQTYYARGNFTKTNGKRTTFPLHRWILDDPKGFVIDHINHDTLNNTRSNLRKITKAENNQNLKKLNKKNTSGVRGVHFNKPSNKWRAGFRLNNKFISLGYFNDIKEAELVVIEARKKYVPFSQEALEE